MFNVTVFIATLNVAEMFADLEMEREFWEGDTEFTFGDGKKVKLCSAENCEPAKELSIACTLQ